MVLEDMGIEYIHRRCGWSAQAEERETGIHLHL